MEKSTNWRDWAKRAKEKNINNVYFDSEYKYHGELKLWKL